MARRRRSHQRGSKRRGRFGGPSHRGMQGYGGMFAETPNRMMEADTPTGEAPIVKIETDNTEEAKLYAARAQLELPETVVPNLEIDSEKHPELFDALAKTYPPDRTEVASNWINEGYRIVQAKDRAKRIHIIDNLDPMPETKDARYRATLEHVRELTPHAKRFIFDGEASTHLGMFIKDRKAWLDARQFALAPYEVTYIQMDIDNVLKAVGEKTTAHQNHDMMDERDMETGYLIHNRMIYPMARGNRRKRGLLDFREYKQDPLIGGLSLFSYEIRDPAKEARCTCQPIFFGKPLFKEGALKTDPRDGPPGSRWDVDDRDHVARAMLLLGSSYNGMKIDETLPFLHDARIHVNIGEDYYRGLSDEQRANKYFQLLGSSAGDFRVILAALLMLNQQKHIQMIYVPNNSMLIGGKRKVVKQHNVVKISLASVDMIKRSLGHKLLTPRAEHDVRGHLRNVHVLKGCEHEWEDLSNPDGTHRRWACVRCKGLRTSVKAHKRGQPEVGKTTSEYEVQE